MLILLKNDAYICVLYQSWVIASSVLANQVEVQVRVRTSTCT